VARRNPTNPDTPDWTLTPQQETAVDLLASGKTVTDTAKAIEVTRQTVSEWLNHHPGFEAALNRRRQELWNGMADTLRGLLPKAMDVLQHELEGATPLPAAIHVLKACGFYGGVLVPQGPTEVEDAAIAQRQRAAHQMLARLAAEPFYSREGTFVTTPQYTG
jgi:hypothetical protein